jgi:hypothetical protein
MVVLTPKFETYPDLLEKQGYVVGLRAKAGGPATSRRAAANAIRRARR